MLNAGTMIASAIFIVPATVAAAVHGSALMTAVWVIGGLVSLLGALSVAELAAAYPEAGGQYAYLREAYGTLWAFIYGYAIWAEIPALNVFIGAIFIVTASLVLVYWERRSDLIAKKRLMS